jgi:hypothetical protein
MTMPVRHPASTSLVALALPASTLVAFAPAALASVIARDNFTYPVGELNTQNGGAGWGNPWAAVTSVTQVVDPAVDLSGDRALQFAGNDNNAAYRQLASPFAGLELFVDFLVQVDAGTLTANDFLALWLDTVTTGDHTNRPNTGIKADGSGTDDVFVRTNGTGGSFVPNSNIGSTPGVTHHIVGRLSNDPTAFGNNYDRFDVWLDPIFGDLGSPGATFSGNAGIAQITQIGFRTSGLDVGDVVLLDDLQLSTTWSEALRIPEPTPLALMGVGLWVGLGRVRRRT